VAEVEQDQVNQLEDMLLVEPQVQVEQDEEKVNQHLPQQKLLPQQLQTQVVVAVVLT
jgi:hypothetical protein